MSQPSENQNSLTNKRALITGGTTGIGRATAIRTAQDGCSVFICGTDESHLADALHDIRATGGEADGIIADLSKTEGVTAVFRAADDWMGGLDIAILNAGIGAAGDFISLSHATCRELVDTNLTAYILCALESFKRMNALGGHVVMIGSMSAEVHEKGSAVYVATKAGIRGFATSLRKEANPLGIKVSLIEPGSVGTDMVEESPETQRRMAGQDLMLRAEDIAEAVHFILMQPDRCDVVHMKLRPHLQSI